MPELRLPVDQERYALSAAYLQRTNAPICYTPARS